MQIHNRERGGAEQAPGGTTAPRPAHTAAPRVKEHNPPSLAASDGLRTYLLPQASRCREREAGWPLTLVLPESNRRTIITALPVVTPPLLEMCITNGTKLTEWCPRRGH